MSIASTQNMHLKMQMQHANTTSLQLQHCMEQAISQHDNHQQHHSSLICSMNMSSVQEIQQCQDCSLLLCHALSVWLSAESTDIAQLSSMIQLDTPVSTYQAQHLMGHWQEILRPPKA